MGGGCPFGAAKMVVPLCMQLFRDRSWRERAIEEGRIGSEWGWVSDGDGILLETREFFKWKIAKEKEVEFSFWLGLLSPTLPFTNAALLLLWFYKTVSLPT